MLNLLATRFMVAIFNPGTALTVKNPVKKLNLILNYLFSLNYTLTGILF